MKILDKSNWNRKEHFDFFNQFDETFFGVTIELDVTNAYKRCKDKNLSFFLYYHYLSTKAANEVKEFKYRIKEDNIVVFDAIHVSTILLRDNKSFVFTFIPFTSTFEEFTIEAKKEFERAKQTTGIGMDENTARLDTIHYSAVPWFSFKGLTHPRNYNSKESNPKITFGKASELNNQLIMPVSIYAHHGLMDGYHLGLYIKRFQDLLNS